MSPTLTITPLKGHLLPYFTQVTQRDPSTLVATSGEGLEFLCQGALIEEEFTSDATVTVYTLTDDGDIGSEVFPAMAAQSWMTDMPTPIDWATMSTTVVEGIASYIAALRRNGALS